MGRQLLLLGVMVLVLASLCKALTVEMTELSTVYLPKFISPGNQEIYSLPHGWMKSIAFDRENKVIYAVHTEMIHVIDASNIRNLTTLAHIRVHDLNFKDVKVCGEGVFATYYNLSDRSDGGVHVTKRYNAAAESMQHLRNIKLGLHCGQSELAVTDNCKLVVGVENRPCLTRNEELIDPPGKVAIIRFPAGIENEPEVKILDFSKFNAQFDQLSRLGVRWVCRANRTFSDTVEPEHVVLSGDQTKAYISLQENNAVAVVDLVTEEITAIHGLGFKLWGELDPSDADGGIHIKDWPIYGMYQPDGIAWFRWNAEDYVVTANEGNTVRIHGSEGLVFDETVRGYNISDASISSSVSDGFKQALRNPTMLGRMKFSSVEGRDVDGKYERFYTFGTRGFSIWRAADMQQVFDSGSDMEKKTAELRPDIFNADIYHDPYNDHRQSADMRSDFKGVETESVEVAEMLYHKLIFAGNEVPGTIAVYSLPLLGTEMKPEFQTLYTDNIPRDNRSYSQMYIDKDAFAIGPETLIFLHPEEGLADFPILLVGATRSATVTALRVHVNLNCPAVTCPVCFGRPHNTFRQTNGCEKCVCGAARNCGEIQCPVCPNGSTVQVHQGNVCPTCVCNP